MDPVGRPGNVRFRVPRETRSSASFLDAARPRGSPRRRSDANDNGNNMRFSEWRDHGHAEFFRIAWCWCTRVQLGLV